MRHDDTPLKAVTALRARDAAVVDCEKKVHVALVARAKALSEARYARRELARVLQSLGRPMWVHAKTRYTVIRTADPELTVEITPLDAPAV